VIDCRAADVEILPNFFSITFISLNDYLRVFADCVDGKGKPIPLVQKLTVKEIKRRLATVHCDSFYITDEDDSQLLGLVGYLTNMRKSGMNGAPVNIYTYNGLSYDNLMIAGFLMNVTHFDNTKDLIRYLYTLSKKIISLQDDKENLYNDFQINTCRRFKLPYVGVDVMRVFALNKAGVRIDKETGERKATPKGLKQTSINLQWFELLEYELPPICDKDAKLYWDNLLYKGLPPEKLDKLIDKWDRFMLPEYIPDMMHYNKNDVFIVCEIVRLNPEEIKSRYSVSSVYKVDVLNSSRSNMADTLFEKFYSQRSGLPPEKWKGKRTERTGMNLGKLIFPCVEFKTPELKNLLEDIKKTTIYRVSKEEFNKEVKIGNTVYSLGTGGLHSQDVPMEIWSTSTYECGTTISASPTGEQEKANTFTLYHADVGSYYPSIMAEYEVAPAHMIKKIFAGLIRWMRDTRITVKHTIEEFVDGIPRDVLALVLKIVINSIYGKFGFEKGDLYDRRAVLEVTINGQLMLLMLCEQLELNGFKIISANTDGLMVKVYDKDKSKYEYIVQWWQEVTRMKMDSDVVHCLIARDVNNYIAQFRTKKGLKLEYKGALNPLMYAVDLQKGYDMPIVAKAVSEYFLNNVPIMDTLRKATNILDFCKTQNVGRQFHVEQTFINNQQVQRVICQRYVRFYISNTGCIIEKVHNDTASRSRMAAGQSVTVINSLDDIDISFRNINYKYYYEEAMKIINPIKLGISPKGRGKTRIKKAYGQFNSLFDDAAFEEELEEVYANEDMDYYEND
jgi:DNA polymerase elongation subunit (family B)